MTILCRFQSFCNKRKSFETIQINFSLTYSICSADQSRILVHFLKSRSKALKSYFEDSEFSGHRYIFHNELKRLLKTEASMPTAQ